MFTILRKVFAIYGMLVFFVQLLLWLPVCWLCFVILGPRAVRPMAWIGHHLIAPFTLLMAGVFRKVRGKAKLSGKGVFIIVANHRSFLDILINAAAFPSIYKFLSKKEMTKIPVWGIIVRMMCILVDRSSAESRTESYNQMKETLASGFSILLYPEGTRNRSDEPLKDFYDGAFRLASETGFPLAVLTSNDSGKLNDPRRELDLRPGIVEVDWDLIEQTKDVDVADLREQTKAVMLGHLSSSSSSSL